MNERFSMDSYALNLNSEIPRGFCLPVNEFQRDIQIFELKAEPLAASDNLNRRTSENYGLRNGFPSSEMRRTVAVII